jgi:predicted transcriptional regulator
MSRIWTDEQRLNASAVAAKRWRSKVLSDPHATELARARVFRAITQRELSQLSGVAVGTIASVEAGGQVSPYVQERLARVLALPELFQ